MRTWTFLALPLLVFGSLAFADFPAQKCEQLKTRLQQGDLVFLAMPNFLFRKVAAATHSWTSHVGIAVMEDGRWEVLESKIPFSKKSGLCEFLNRTEDGYYAVRRLRSAPLSAAQIEALKAAASKHMGVLYDLGFNYDSGREFCSKFVAQVYQEALGVNIGRVETFGDLIRRYPNDPTMEFWKFYFLGNIPTDRRTITPGSLYADPNLVTVEESLP